MDPGSPELLRDGDARRNWFMTDFGFVMLVIISIGAYVIGCFSTGYYLMLWRTGQDIRSIGSNSTGARNVGRFLGHRALLITVAGDSGKGMLAVFLAGRFESPPSATLVAMLAVTVGHAWPIQLGFRGGKGVATSLGALLIWSPFLYAVFAAIFFLGYATCRNATLAVCACFVILPIVHLVFSGALVEFAVLALISALIIFLHRDNISEALSHCCH